MFTFTTWFVAISIMAASTPTFANIPRYVVSPSTSSTDFLEGTDIVLNCQVTDYNGFILFWTVNIADDLFAIGPFSNINPKVYPRYAIIGDSGAGVYNLRVSKAVFSDSGNYTCELINSNGDPVLSETVEVIIYSPQPPVNDAPSCRSAMQLQATEGDIAAVSCTSTGGKPPASLQWRQGNRIIRGNYTSYEDPVPNEDYNAINRHEWVLTHNDDGAMYECLETHTTLENSRICTIGPFNVAHKPVVTVRPNAYEVDITQSQNITFRCSSKANPDTSEPFVWSFNGTEITLEEDGFSVSNDSLRSRLTIYGVTDQYIGMRVYCAAKNSIGTTNSSATFVKMNSKKSIKNSDTLMMIIGIIIAVGLVSVVFAVVGMHFATGASCDCGYTTAQHQKRRRKQQMQATNTNSDRPRDDLGLDLDQFEGGSNQRTQDDIRLAPMPAQTGPNNYEPGQPQPSPQPEANIEGYNNPTFINNERPNGTAETQIQESPPDPKDDINEDKDGTSHRVKMARKKKREATAKQKGVAVPGDYPDRLPDNQEDWIM